MQKNVEQMTKRQLAAQTLRENLAILYDEFSEAIGHSCYRELSASVSRSACGRHVDAWSRSNSMKPCKQK